tara:strand:- start:123739 stop:124353 length:615 start_codon:yes stop_codon:yes gene_type:complete
MKSLLLCFTLVFFVACSGSSNSSDSDSGIELADAVEFNEADGGDVMGEPLAADSGMTADNSMSQLEMSEPMVELGTEQRTYTVKKNETLMMIAFQVYGDYRRWKSIADLNQDVLNGSQTIKEGMQLRYMAPQQEFIFSPSGNPYLIQNGDTLGKISTTTYGTKKHWKDIWNNNKPLIRDPNKIYAGFTIFTPNLEGRDVAFDDL